MTTNTKMMGRLIAVLFLSRELAHREHLRTKSYSQHVALNTFYDEVIDQPSQTQLIPIFGVYPLQARHQQVAVAITLFQTAALLHS